MICGSTVVTVTVSSGPTLRRSSGALAAVAGAVGDGGVNSSKDVNPVELLTTTSRSAALTKPLRSMSRLLVITVGVNPLALLTITSLSAALTAVVASFPVSPTWLPQ